MTAHLLEEVRTLAADVLGVPRSQVQGDSTPEHIENWDSIQHVSLMIAIEEQFGVEFNPDEIGHMESIGKIAELLSGKLNTRTD
ncbi:MAG TPA: acyl carrier protein [Thermoanaerobaculia bacterium]|jgi:acyl carrier protein|nr:acyl carrier protein [Thermoanaerobaculia bacterium]